MSASAGLPIGDGDRSTEGRGHVALVTGASSGIGRSLSELLAAKGYDLIPVARRADRLEELKRELEPRWDISVDPLAADLSDPESPRLIAEEVARRGVRVDFLVNNAGYSAMGRFGDAPWEEHERRVRVLGLAVLELTHRMLPGMVEQRWGRILNVASIAALLSGSPQDVLYGPTKAMVLKFSEGLAVEYRTDGVHCTASMPGFTDTEIFVVSGWAGEAETNRIMRLAMMRPETVARQAYAAVMVGRVSIVHGRHHQALGTVVSHLPAGARRRLSAALSGGIEGDTPTAPGSTTAAPAASPLVRPRG
jgi:hypothetical protein